ncbi:hypothetical protein [Bartonella sp. HY761]|uniref:hypothetical protein n=1 Tax=Bartonella sp. HY761 TaxID=2979330 RepID=UPI002206E391|nr:hypothetical protein [Bartonella sp. HY761]UXN05306.1 hypothetical protein N6A79_08220 [Bartonella sp. HY761]
MRKDAKITAAIASKAFEHTLNTSHTFHILYDDYRNKKARFVSKAGFFNTKRA